MTVQAHRAMHAALQHREKYLRKLRETIADLPVPGAKPAPHKCAASGGARQGDGQDELLLLASRTLKLPRGWLTNASRALEQACADIIPAADVRRTGSFACSLIHPSFVIPPHLTSSTSLSAVRAIRSRVAMPLCVLWNGSACLRVVAELSHKHSEAVALARHTASAHEYDMHDTDFQAGDAHNSDATSAPTPQRPDRMNTPLSVLMGDVTVPSLHRRTLCCLPSALGLNTLILLDKSAFPSTQTARPTKSGLHPVSGNDAHTTTGTASDSREHSCMDSRLPNALPDEVAMEATVALCGAVYLAGGMHAVAAFLDRALRLT